MVQESSLAFHTRKLRLSEAELPAQGHAAQYSNQNPNLKAPAANSLLLFPLYCQRGA